MRVLEVLGGLMFAIVLGVGTFKVLMFLLRRSGAVPITKEDEQCQDESQTSKTTNHNEGL